MFPETNHVQDNEIDQTLNQPAINIANIENFYAFDNKSNLPDDLRLDQGDVFLDLTSKSTRRSLKRKLKKIVKQAHRVYDSMVKDQFLMSDDNYEVQM